MDWNLAIERNHWALKRIVAMLVAMAGLDAVTSPLAGEDGSARRGEAEALAEAGEGAPAPTLPRHLHRAILRLLRPFRPRPRRTAANGIPRISLPGVTQPFPVVPRRPTASDDPLNATRLALRLQALGAALDDLPRQARRFARWRAARAANRDAAGAQNKNRDAAGAQNRKPDASGAQGRKQRARRIWPLRPGRPPGQRPASQRTHEVYEILHDLHGLAFDVLECPDTS